MKNNPFASLRTTLGMPDTPAPERPDEAAPEPQHSGTSEPRNLGTPEPRLSGRVVVRYERAGRGGKEATIVDHLQLPAAELATLLKSLKASLGCGGALDGDAIMLQGDHRKRLPALLTKLGVKKVVTS